MLVVIYTQIYRYLRYYQVPTTTRYDSSYLYI
eukprot:COSAG05_NODE_1242_length_5418_cov_8.384471_6_plen_32_part_00